ncbi:hypothetical protein [Streptomyces sp. 3214.6]|jgi:hypothetical protein|uniref:hypothetical protein n=1 Tax=Streptomyces sp. 3214.6 TaxID=1882757 RepID=UPI000909E4B1|nr:hypothetical protein [Streptomyces sp. 3214.6]SHI67814.1 hypothetical protein SAMN05444521_8213 [Streptomyces sp. 3214.6]
MRFYVMSGPNQGDTGTMTDGVGEIQLPHPTAVGVHCRYKVNTSDALIEQEGFEPGVQLHYAGDVLSSR